jgi:hypothetical protein
MLSQFGWRQFLLGIVSAIGSAADDGAHCAAAEMSSPAHKSSWRQGCQLDMVCDWAAAPIGA